MVLAPTEEVPIVILMALITTIIAQGYGLVSIGENIYFLSHCFQCFIRGPYLRKIMFFSCFRLEAFDGKHVPAFFGRALFKTSPTVSMPCPASPAIFMLTSKAARPL